MPIIYALVARGMEVLSEHTHANHTGNFGEIAQKIIARIQAQRDSKLTYVFEGHTFNFRLRSPYIFMCMADEEFGRNMPFVFLKDVGDEFLHAHPSSAQAPASAFRSFDDVLERKMAHYASPDEAGTVRQVQTGLEEVKDVMRMNIGKVLKRGDQIEVLVDKTENLSFTSDNFRIQSRTLKKNLCWQNAKMKLMAGLLILTLVYLVAASVCGLSLGECGGSGEQG